MELRQWHAQSDQHRWYLFGEGESTGRDPRIRPLASIAITMNLKSYHHERDISREAVVRGAHRVLLAYKNLTAKEEDKTPLETSLSTNFSYITELTGQILWYWERAAWHDLSPQQFLDLPEKLESTSFVRPDVQRVLITADAVQQILEEGYPPHDPDTANGRNMIKVIATYGPQFMVAWSRGDIIRDYCREHNEDPGEWLKLFTSLGLRRVLLRHIEDPIRAVEKVVRSARQTSVQRPLVGGNVERVYQHGWLGARAGYREELIGDTFFEFHEHGQNIPDSLARTAFRTPIAYRVLSQREREDAEFSTFVEVTLPNRIAQILNLHQIEAEIDGGYAIFGITDQEKNLPLVVRHTINVIIHWVRAARRRGRPLPFSQLSAPPQPVVFEHPEVQKVIETAAIVCECLQAGLFPGTANNNAYTRSISKAIAIRGSEFISAWIRGDILRASYVHHKTYAERRLEHFSRAQLASIIALESRMPLRQVKSIISRYGHIRGNVSKIRDATRGWEMEKYRAVFPPTALFEVAFKHQHVLRAIRQIAVRVDEVMTTENLAKKLGTNPALVDKVFAPWMRYSLARNNRDPIPAAKEILGIFNVLTATYGLSWELAAISAFQHRITAIPRAEVVRQLADSRPDKVGEGMWNAAVMRYPRPDQARKRLQNLAGFRAWLGIESPYSFEYRSDESGSTAGEKRFVPEESRALDPGEILTAAVAGDFLQGIAREAGVSLVDVAGLLHYFQAGAEIDEVPPELRKAFQNLQRAAQKRQKE